MQILRATGKVGSALPLKKSLTLDGLTPISSANDAMIQDIPSWFAAQNIKYDFTHRPKDTASDDSDYVPHDVTVAPRSLLAEYTGAATIEATYKVTKF